MGLCPECGAKTLFAGPIAFADRCRSCGLDYGRYNVGDGPAAFLTLIIGALVIALAMIVETVFSPPFIVHAIIWIPFTTAAVIFGFRAVKAALLVTENRKQFREGTIDKGDDA